MKRFYIYDCTGKTVGNPKGYRTMRGALIQQNKIGSKAYNEIYETFREQKALYPDLRLIARVE